MADEKYCATIYHKDWTKKKLYGNDPDALEASCRQYAALHAVYVWRVVFLPTAGLYSEWRLGVVQ